MPKNKLTQEQIESIKNYGKEIKTLGSFVETGRKMPGMWIGHLGNKGFINMIREIFQNAVDELMRINSPCDMIKITYDENTFTVIIEDNGKGIPFGEIIRIFTKQSTSSNYEKKPFEYTSGRHGAGGKVTNALSSKFIVESYVLGEARRVEFDNGIPWDKGELKIPNNNNKQGSIILFQPSFEIMGEITSKYNDSLNLIDSIMPLTKIGSKTYFKAITLTGKEINTELINEYGILTYIMDSTESPLIKPIQYGNDTGFMRASIAFTYDVNNVQYPEIISSYANFCPMDTRESSHVKGFISGLKKFFISYMNKIYLNNGNNSKRKIKLVIKESDIRTGLRVALDVAHIEPIFTGQAKEILSNDDMEKFVEQLTSETLDQWSKDNPQDLQKLCKYFKDIAEIRSKSDEGKVKLNNQYNAGHSGLPTKYTAPIKKRVDLYIVEGDSAGGSGKNNKDNDTQGIFPIRGKIINCFEKTEKKCLENAEVAGILAIVGAGYGKTFDINKVKWERIISCADADPDGNHINSLLLRLVLKFCPDLIKAGKFYKAVPPLFSIKKGKEMIYFTTRMDYVQYMQKDFSKKYEICTTNDKKLNQNEIVELLYNNIDYVYELEKIGNRYKLDFILLELFLLNKDELPNKLEKIIKKQFRFMKMQSFNGIPTIEGIINDVYNTLFINNRIISDSKIVIDIINNNLYKYYKVNGEIISLYSLMKLYEKNEPSSIIRYKGLGEMEPEELAISTILPRSKGGQRVLVRYTMEDAIKEINQIRYLESNKNKLLEDMGNISRIDVLD